MNHKPFEILLFSDEPLSSEQVNVLQAHLKECEHCRLLSSAWSEMKHLFRTESIVKPAEGFTHRWQSRLAVDVLREQQRKHRRQSWWIFALDTGIAVVLFMLLAAQILNAYGTPTNLLLTGVYRITAYFSYVYAIGEVLTTILGAVASVVHPMLWLSLLFALVIMNLFWLYSLKVILMPWRMR
jgi:predicted anti-sigma-YlaC factor YlaD